VGDLTDTPYRVRPMVEPRDPRRGVRRARRNRGATIGPDAPWWLNLLWVGAFPLAVAIGVRVAQTGWRLGILEIAFVVVAFAILFGSVAAARPR
jgi:hypothetical protein